MLFRSTTAAPSPRSRLPGFDLGFPGSRGPVLAAPLRFERQLLGVLLVGTSAHATALEPAVEPFAVALRNDTRLHELARLREAAEQDRTALLARLARQDVSDAIVGAERGLGQVMARVGQVAPTDAPMRTVRGHACVTFGVGSWSGRPIPCRRGSIRLPSTGPTS